MSILIIVLLIVALCVIGNRFSIKSKISYVESRLSLIVSLLHYYDSFDRSRIEESHWHLYMVYHLFLANILTSEKTRNMGPQTTFEIIENKRKKTIQLQDVAGSLMRHIQRRVEQLPDEYREEILVKIILTQDGVLKTETNLLAELQRRYRELDMPMLEKFSFGSDIF